jgi:hypothetical protein
MGGKFKFAECHRIIYKSCDETVPALSTRPTLGTTKRGEKRK